VRPIRLRIATTKEGESMKKRILLVLLALVLVVSLAAFAACKAEEEEEEEVEGWQWPERLMVGTAGVGDQNYVVSIAWTTPMASTRRGNRQPETGVPLG